MLFIRYFLLAAIFFTAVPAWAFDYGQGRGMGAGVAVVADHSAIEMNPAGITQLPFYTVGSLFFHEETGAAFGFSLLDNRTTGIGMGLDYRNERPIEGRSREYGALLDHKLVIALGEYYEDKLHIGFAYVFEREKLGLANGVTQITKDNHHNLNVGLIVPVNQKLRMGIVGYDLAWFGDKAPPPRTTGGIGWLPHKYVVLVADVIQVSDNYKHWQGALGADFLIDEQFALRGGYHQDYWKATDRPITWSAGLGWFFPKGQLSYSFNTVVEKYFRHTLALEVRVGED